MFLSDALFNIWPIEHFSIHFESVIFEQWSTNNATKNESKKKNGKEDEKKNKPKIHFIHETWKSVNAIIQWVSIVNGTLARYDLMYCCCEFDAINVQIKWIDNATQINPICFVLFRICWIILTPSSEDSFSHWDDTQCTDRKRDGNVQWPNTECCWGDNCFLKWTHVLNVFSSGTLNPFIIETFEELLYLRNRMNIRSIVCRT